MIESPVTFPPSRSIQKGMLLLAAAFYATAICWLLWKGYVGGGFERTLMIVVGTVLVLIGGVTLSALWKILAAGERAAAPPPARPASDLEGAFADTGHEVLFRPLVKTGFGYVFLFALLLGVVLCGAYAYSTQLRTGLGVTGLRRPVFWGIYMTNFVFFIGISHAGTLISAILRVTKAEWRRPITRAAEAITVFALCIGAPQVLVDLGRIDRLWNVIEFGRFQSPLLWDVCCITTYLVGSITYLYLPLIPDLAMIRDRLPERCRLRRFFYGTLAMSWKGTPEQERLLEKTIGFMAVVIIPVAISVHTVVSWVFAMTIQPMWHSTILGAYFVIGAIFTGIASILIAMAILRKVFRLERYFRPVHFNNLGLLLLTFCLLWAYATLSEYLTTFYGNEPAHMSVFNAKFSGEFAPVFWTMVVCCFVIPVPILALKRTRTIAGTLVASICVNVGMWLERYTIVVPTLTHPRLPYRVAYYQPSWVELSVTAASFAALALLYMAFLKIFPVVSVWEVSQTDEPADSGNPPTGDAPRGLHPQTRPKEGVVGNSNGPGTRTG